MSNGNITKYMEKYFDEKFGNIVEEIKGLKIEIKEIKIDLKKNGKCLHEINTKTVLYSSRFRVLSFVVAGIVIVLLLGVLNGLELVTKGVLKFL